MISGKKFLVGGKNLSLLLNKLNTKKIPFYDLENVLDKIYITIPTKWVKTFLNLVQKSWQVTFIKKVGFSGFADKLLKHLGIIIGAIIFVFSTFVFDNLVLGVKIEADSSLHSGIKEVLNKNQVEKYTWFKRLDLKSLQEQIYAENPLICYSSVYKRGNTLIIKAERAVSFTGGIDKSITELTSSVNGEILELKVLRGYPLKKAGEKVTKGEILVSGSKVEEDKVYNTYVLASAKILCTYTYESKDKKEFALTLAKLKCNQEEYLLEETKIDGDKVIVTLKYIVQIGETI